MNYHPDVKWHLQPGKPPNTPGQVADSTPNSLHFEVKKLDYFVDPSPHDLPMLKRESMFVQLLEGLHESEADLIVAAKDKVLHQKYKGLSANVDELHVADMFSDFCADWMSEGYA